MSEEKETPNEYLEIAQELVKELEPENTVYRSLSENKPKESADDELDTQALALLEDEEEPKPEEEGSEDEEPKTEEAPQADEKEPSKEDGSEAPESEASKDTEEKEGEDKHTVKVDGEEREVSLQDLKDNYSGQQSYDKKFQELADDKTEFRVQADSFNNNATKFQELVTGGKAQEALDFLLETAGLDRNLFVETYISQLAPTISEYLDLSPAERDQRALKQQVEHYKTQNERMVTSQKDELATNAYKTKVMNVLDTHGIDAVEYAARQKELTDAGCESTPEAIGSYCVVIKHNDAAHKALSVISPELARDSSALDYLISLQVNTPGISEKELSKKAKQAFEAEAKEALTERVKKDSKASKPRKKGAAKVEKEPLKQILTFDDLEDIDPYELLEQIKGD